MELLHTKYLLSGRLYELEQDGVPFASLSMDAARLSRLISSSVAREEYQLEPARIRRVRSHGKLREVFSFRLTDLIVSRAVSRLIEEAAEPALSPQLYSYRKGSSWIAPASDFAAYVRNYGKATDAKSRGLYVLRRDIASYTDTIPVGERSRVWGLIRRVLEARWANATPYQWSLIQSVVRPVVSGGKGAVYCQLRGLPTGQPIAPVLYNLYLVELDHELAQLPGAFYARYSDDIVFAHFDPQVVKHAERRIEETLSRFGLDLNGEKSKNLYLNAAGRPPVDWEGGRGASAVPLVGTSVSAHGTVALNRQKMRRLLREINRRAVRTANASRGKDPAHVGSDVCAVINRALEAREGSGGERSAFLIRRVVTDRAQLRQLDYWIARAVLRAVTGDANVRAFRRYPYRKIRRDWGLKSLLHARNRWTRIA